LGQHRALRACGTGDAIRRRSQEARTRMKALTIHPLSTHSKRVLFALLTCATGCASGASDSDPTANVSQAVSDHNRDSWEAKHCNDDDIESVTRTDYLLPFTSNLPSPNNQGQAYLDIRLVKPVYKKNPDAPAYGSQCTPKGVMVGIHGRSIDIVTSTDAPYNDYSLVEALAKRGITSYLVNLLGTGLSSRFSMDNACTAYPVDSERYSRL